jgi:signal transduction histidine kinase
VSADTARAKRSGGSLFWTFTGVFLITIIAGAAVQWFVASGVLGPLEQRDARNRAESAVSKAAVAIAALPDPADAEAIRAILGRADEPGMPGRLLYRSADGRVVVGGLGRVRGGRRAARFEGAPPGERGGPGDRGELGEPPPGPPRGRGEFFGRPGFVPRREVLARQDVLRGGQPVGEVIALRFARPPLGIVGSRTSLLFLPITVLAATVAGLFMVRILVRRLRGLETLAARVASGDLSARIHDPSGDEIGRVAQRFDEMTENLADAKRRVEETAEQRRRLFADITHELATPLTSIRGYAETLVDPGVGTTDEERARYLRGILEESRRMDQLIKDLFDLARLEAGATPLTRERIDLAALSKNTIDRFEPRFHAAGLKVSWRRLDGDATILADGRRMEQVVENLLTNELRYVPSGGNVEVALGPTPDGRVRLEVSDDGHGIAPEDRERVFERFYRAVGPRSDGAEDKGSGLGLAIVREIVERHGGTVRAEARSPRGLSMVVELPRAGA